MSRCTQQVIPSPPLPEPKPPPPGGKSMPGTSERGVAEECSNYSTETAESTRLDGRVKGSKVLDASPSTPKIAARSNQRRTPQKDTQEAMRVALASLEDLYRLEKEKGEKSRAKATAEREALEATVRVRCSESLESANTPSGQGSTNDVVDNGHEKSVSEGATVADAALLVHLRRENVKLEERFGLVVLKARALEARVEANTRKVDCDRECNRLMTLTERSAADCERMEAEIAAIADTAASDNQQSEQHVESEERKRVDMLARTTRAEEDMNRLRGVLEASRKSKQVHCEMESKRIHDGHRFLQENEELTIRRNALREAKAASYKKAVNLEAELAGRQREFDENLPEWTKQLSDLECARQALESRTKKLLQRSH